MVVFGGTCDYSRIVVNMVISSWLMLAIEIADVFRSFVVKYPSIDDFPIYKACLFLIEVTQELWRQYGLKSWCRGLG